MSIENNKSESVLKCLEKYFAENSSKRNLEDYQNIKDILNNSIFTSSKYTIDDIVSAIHADPNIRFSLRGHSVRPKPVESNRDPLIILSKKLAAILRHGLYRYNLEVINGCYVKIDDLLKIPMFKGYTKKDILMVINTNRKRRYEIIQHGSCEFIGALQGHSIPVGNDNLEPLLDSSNLKFAYHGTFCINWESIKATGLKKMRRNHIHLCPSEFSGIMREGVEIIIEINLEQALKDGLKFYKAKNNVILCDGDNGIFKKDYFTKAWNIKTNEILLSNSLEPSDSIL